MKEPQEMQEKKRCAICGEELKETSISYETDSGTICRWCFESAEEQLYLKAKTVTDRLLSTLDDVYKAVAMSEESEALNNAFTEALTEWREENS